VDSTLLLHAAIEAMGQEKVTVFHGISELVSDREKQSAATILDELQIEQNKRQEIELHPLIWSEFVANTQDRCYFCKKRMYQSFLRTIEKLGCQVLFDGSNVDDLKTGRPGFRAIHELGVQTPLLDAGLNKVNVRLLAREFNLSNHDKASNSCLATRLPEGRGIDKEGLTLVEKCEDFLLKRGFIGCRVRPEGKSIVLELTGKDGERLLTSSVRIDIIPFFQSIGFSRILLDLTSRR